MPFPGEVHEVHRVGRLFRELRGENHCRPRACPRRAPKFGRPLTVLHRAPPLASPSQPRDRFGGMWNIPATEPSRQLDRGRASIQETSGGFGKCSCRCFRGPGGALHSVDRIAPSRPPRRPVSRKATKARRHKAESKTWIAQAEPGRLTSGLSERDTYLFDKKYVSPFPPIRGPAIARKVKEWRRWVRLEGLPRPVHTLGEVQLSTREAARP